MTSDGRLIDSATYYLLRGWSLADSRVRLRKRYDVPAPLARISVAKASQSILAAALVEMDPAQLFKRGVVPESDDIPPGVIRFRLFTEGDWGTREPIVDARVEDIVITSRGIEVAGAHLTGIKGSKYIPPRSTYTFAELVEAYLQAKYDDEARKVPHVRLAAIVAARNFLRERKGK